MQPAFVSEPAWAAIPHHARDNILHAASTAVRRGDPQREAFWQSVVGHLEQDFFDAFDVDRTFGEFAWPLVVKEDALSRARVSHTLALYAGAAAGGDSSLADEMLQLSADEVWRRLNVPEADGVCVYCGTPCPSRTDERLSRSCCSDQCLAGLRSLKTHLYEWVADRLDVSCANVAQGVSEDTPTEKHAKLDASKGDELIRSAVAVTLRAEFDVGSALDLFEGEAIEQEPEMAPQ